VTSCHDKPSHPAEKKRPPCGGLCLNAGCQAQPPLAAVTSRLPMIAASVRTRMVYWNEAAEMNESVDSDALVMPSSM
jgi:hypothetical protein